MSRSRHTDDGELKSRRNDLIDDNQFAVLDVRANER